MLTLFLSVLVFVTLDSLLLFVDTPAHLPTPINTPKHTHTYTQYHIPLRKENRFHIYYIGSDTVHSSSRLRRGDNYSNGLP